MTPIFVSANVAKAKLKETRRNVRFVLSSLLT